MDKKKVTTETTRDDETDTQSSTQQQSATSNNNNPTSTSTTSKDSASAVVGSLAGAGGDKNNNNKNNNNIQKQRSKRPRKQTHFGKADPVRDISIFLGFVTFMFFVAWCFNDVGKVEEFPIKKPTIQEQLHEVQEQIAELMSVNKKEKTVRPGCDLILSPSSVPGDGFGLYAGRNYSKGEDIIISSHFLAIDLHTGGKQNQKLVFVPSFALIIKPHPSMHNAEGTNLWSIGTPMENNYYYVLKASKDIVEGNEILVPYNIHPMHILGKSSAAAAHLFSAIPRQQDYMIADSIIRDEVIQLKGRNKKNKHRDKEAMKLIGGGVSNTRKAVQKFNPRVASILPEDAEGLLPYRYGESSTFLAMQNRTYNSLSYSGQCIDSVESTSSMAVAAAKFGFKQGDVIMFVPIYPYKQSGLNLECNVQAQECIIPQSVNHCFCHDTSFYVFCPIYPKLPVIYNERDWEDKNLPEPNAKFRWNTKFFIRQKRNGIPNIEIDQVFSTPLLWEIIALRNIKPGEKIIVEIEYNSQLGMLQIDDDQFPDKWRVKDKM